MKLTNPFPYDHRSIELKWRNVWQKVGLDLCDIAQVKKRFYNLMMFPYPSAEGLHVGNMYAFTGSDIYGRFKRMQGYDVFEPIGLDGFGIHSENYALKIGRHPMDHAALTEKNFYSQLQTIGAMFDWSRALETYDPEYYRWTQWLFVQMFKHGLAYRGKAQVNWCLGCKTVLADEQVIPARPAGGEGVCERCGNIVGKRLLEQWFFKITAYAGKLLEHLDSLDWSEKIKVAQRNWIGKKIGVTIYHNVEGLDIRLNTFSAYPAWLFADTFLVIAPEHPLVKKLIDNSPTKEAVQKYLSDYTKASKQSNNTIHQTKEGVFTGRYALDPFNNNARMPIWIANFALMDFGTGIIRCSAHDIRDFEFAVKYQIPLKEVVEREDPKNPVNAHENNGVLKNSGPFSGKEISDELISDIITWIEIEKIGKRETTYHLRDWLISRQRYWGPPIPMIHCEVCARQSKGERADMPGWWSVPEDQLPVVLPRIEDYKPGEDGVAPLAKHKEFYETTCPGCGGKAVRETDVSDTFLDSSWYYLRYPSTRSARSGQVPFDSEITKKWLPVDMYTGGAEHAVLHLLYSRFITMALHDMGYLEFDEPFTNFFAHGLVIKDGAKMSKSKGNIINPDIYIEQYGADALRLYLMFMGPFSQGGDFRDSAMEGMSRWVGRVWRLAITSMTNPPAGEAGDKLPMTNEDVKRSLHQLIKKVGEDTQKRRYNTAIAAMMSFTNLVSDHGGVLAPEDLQKFIFLLAPYAPYLAEEIFQRIRKADTPFFSVHTQPWPDFDVSMVTEYTHMIIVQVNGKHRDTIAMQRASSREQREVENIARISAKVVKYLEGKTVKKVIFVPNKLINFVL